MEINKTMKTSNSLQELRIKLKGVTLGVIPDTLIARTSPVVDALKLVEGGRFAKARDLLLETDEPTG